jgi:BolA protein
MSDRRQLIEHRLRTGLDAVHIEVIDDSARHQGHPGAQPGAGHFRVLVVSERFSGLSRVAAQRLVYDLLADQLEHDIHALQLRTLTPAEWRSRP